MSLCFIPTQWWPEPAPPRSTVTDGSTGPAVLRANVYHGLIPEPRYDGSGTIWVPWPEYEEAMPVVQVAGLPRAAAVGDAEDYGRRWMTTWQRLWEEADIPPYDAVARAAFAAGTRVQRDSTTNPGKFTQVIDRGVAARMPIRYDTQSDGSIRDSWWWVCPSHPMNSYYTRASTYELPGLSEASTREALSLLEGHRDLRWSDLAAMSAPAVYQNPGNNNDTYEFMFPAYMFQALSPTGTVGLYRDTWFEPSIDPHDDLGIISGGDWRDQALNYLTRKAAIDTLGTVSMMQGISTASVEHDDLWEACQDTWLHTRARGDSNGTGNMRHAIETRWHGGTRLAHSIQPPTDVYVAWVDDYQNAGVVYCEEQRDTYVHDASTGERIKLTNSHPERVVALLTQFDNGRFLAIDHGVFEGACNPGERTPAFEEALAWRHDGPLYSQNVADGRITQVRVDEWLSFDPLEIWWAYRNQSWDLQARCASGVPNGVVVDGEFAPKVDLLCTPAQWQTTADNAIAAAARAS